MSKKALIIGNSDGIGLAVTRALLNQDWQVVGISRSPSPITDSFYIHNTAEVQNPDYLNCLKAVYDKTGPFDLCLYSVGIGKLLDFSNMSCEIDIVDVNLIGMIRTVSVVIPHMVETSSGHFIGISSVADVLLSPEAPSYHASKAGLSSYLESLALALKNTGVSVTNIRFGFVDTKMAKGDVKPFMMSADRAANHVLFCIRKKPVRYTAPKVVIPLVKFRDFMLRLKL
jgi:short-subunit dehydrogenase